MSEKTDTLSSLLAPFGLSEEEANIYLYLLKNTTATVVNISKHVAMGRTKVYRLLDKLRQLQLVEIHVGTRGMRFAAAPPDVLQQLLMAKKTEVSRIEHSLEALVAELHTLTPATDGSSKVVYYKGVEGLTQVSYNTIKANGMLRVFEKSQLHTFLDAAVAEDIRKKHVQRGIFTRDITNKREIEAYTDVHELIQHHSEYRYIDTKKLTIRFETLIYNDVYATYTHSGSEIFCVEIYNEQLAAMQKQLFDFVWTSAEKMEYTSTDGAAQISFEDL